MSRAALLLSAALLLAAAGCSTADTDAGNAAMGDGAAPAAPATWAGRSPGGAVVWVQPDSFPVRAGPVRFRVTVEDGAVAGRLSADLVSPAMPVHGITRYEAERAADGSYVVAAEIPMEGRWMLYINLDDGADAVPFEFDVAPADSGAAGQPGDHGPHAAGTRG